MSRLSALRHLVVRGPLDAWRDSGTDVLDLQLVQTAQDSMIRFRTDDRAWRIEVQDGVPGPDAHTNDHMTPFDVATPSGFPLEYGWNGRLVDDATWQIGHYDSPSVWGHHFTVPPVPPGRDTDVTA